MRIYDEEVPVGKIVAGAFGVLVLLYALGFLATGGDLAIYSFWAPKRAAAENHVFHNTQQYTDGKAVYIAKLCREESRADGAQKAALRDEIATESTTVDVAKLPAQVQACIGGN